MLVSAVVPLYNKAPYVQRALTSILAQTVKDFEVIVVDDGSTDGGLGDAAGQLDKRIRVIAQKNAGPGAARNRGINEAKGEYIAFLDADDEWMPSYLSTSLDILYKFPRVAAMTSGCRYIPAGSSSGELFGKRGLSEGVYKVGTDTDPAELVNALAFMWPGSTVARTEVVRRFGGFYDKTRSTYGEDAVLWLKVLLNEPVYFHLEPLTYFHREASALSGNYRGPRAIEPFLLDPEDVASFCPAELSGILRSFYAIRACKTAAVLGYWGQWRAARDIVRRFVSKRDWRVPLFVSALMASTPAAVLVGAGLRTIEKMLRSQPSVVAQTSSGIH